MSQAGEINIVQNHPEIPTIFSTNSGDAIPIANELEILGTGAVFTSGATNVVTISVIGVAETLTGNTGGAVGPDGANNINVLGDTTTVEVAGDPATHTLTISTAGTVATSYVTNSGTAVPASGVLDVLGASVAAGSTPVATTGSGHTVTVDVQTSQAIASTDATKIGLAAFNSADFTVDANGFVSAAGTGFLETLTGNSGGPISPTSNNINTLGTGSITIVGSGSTLTTELTGLTDHAVLVGAGTATITKVGPTATAGQVLQSQGSSSDPAFSTATYPSTTTINQILYSSSANVVAGLATADNGVLITSSTGVPSILADGTTGQVLTATTGSPPSWESPAASSISITGDTGTITGNSFTIYAHNSAQNCGSSVLFSNSGSTSTLSVTDANFNTLIGIRCGNSTAAADASDNTGLGYQALTSVTTGANNTCIGVISGTSILDAANNVGVGNSSITNLTHGSQNNAIGDSALGGVTTGSYNIGIGYQAGVSYTSSESSNIVISNLGVLSESNVIRIGSQGTGSGQQSTCYVAGIVGVTVSNQEFVTINSSTGQLGVASASVGKWIDESANFNAVAGNGYFVTATATGTLPSSPSQGNTISFAVDSVSGILTITANTGQTIQVGTAISASAGTCASNKNGDSINLVYRSSDAKWIAVGAPQGTWTVT